MPRPQPPPSSTRGLTLAVAAYGLWGSFPLFFSLLAAISPWEVLAQRVVWACVALLLVVLVLGQGGQLRQLLGNRQRLLWLFLSALLISINWLVFIWAVSAQRVLEASLGYFITPLVSLLLGRVLLGEQLSSSQLAAAWVAFAAVLFEVVALGALPWVSLVLALSFGCYGLVRKLQPVNALHGLTVETLLLVPLALTFLAWQSHLGALAFGAELSPTLLLVAAGVITAVPLVLFAAAAARLDLTVVGFIMYLNPSLQFLTAIFLLEETFPAARTVTFALVWLAMGLFLQGLWRSRSRGRG